MEVEEHIETYISSQPDLKGDEIRELHQRILQVFPGCKLWFHDSKNSEGKVVANPTIGYGSQTMKYADGKTMEWFRIGISANKTGISVYILGIKDKEFLTQTYGKELGKAGVTGYCIKFKTLNDINVNILEAAIKYGLELDL